MKLNKAFSSLFAVITVACMLVSCTATQSPTPAPTSAATAAPAVQTPAAPAASTPAAAATPSAAAAKTTAPTAKPTNYKITYAAWTSGAIQDNSVAEKSIEAAFPGVDLVPLAFERASWKEQINTRVAGGDIPDIIFRDDRTLLEQYVTQQILTEIPIKLLKENAPTCYKEICEYGYDTWLSSYINGKIYGIPSTTINNTMPFTNGIRMDWLSGSGISTVPTTIEEMTAAFDAFVNKDPDKNNLKDTYAVTANGMTGMLTAFSAIYGAYGVFPDKWMLNKDGNGVEYGVVSQKMKPALQLLNSWYKAGYIDPEFVTNDAAKVKQKWANGQVGFIETTWGRLVEKAEMYVALKNVNPKAEIAMCPAPIGPGGHGYSNWGRIAGSFAFGKPLEKDAGKFAVCLQILDKLCGDPDIYQLTHRGEQGKHWDYDPTTKLVVTINGYNDAEKKAEIGSALLWGLPLPSLQKQFSLPDNLAEVSKYAVDTTLVDTVDYFNYVGALIPAEAKQSADSATQMESRWLIEFITGSKNISEFDTFVSQWMAAGGKGLTEAANVVYKNGTKQMSEIEALMR